MLPSRSSGVEDKPAKETDKPHAERQDRYGHLWCLEDQDYFRTEGNGQSCGRNGALGPQS